MGLHPQLQDALRLGVFWITQRIAIGQFATETRCRCLTEQGVTHILNVSDSGPSVPKGSQFRQITSVPLSDLEIIPRVDALRCLDFIHDTMSLPDAKLYLHCVAGQNRSPTVLWLFLLATGMEPATAERLIVERSPNSIPGHRALVDDALIASVRAHGLKRRMTEHPPAVTAPAY